MMAKMEVKGSVASRGSTSAKGGQSVVSRGSTLAKGGQSVVSRGSKLAKKAREQLEQPKGTENASYSAHARNRGGGGVGLCWCEQGVEERRCFGRWEAGFV